MILRPEALHFLEFLLTDERWLPQPQTSYSLPSRQNREEMIPFLVVQFYLEGKRFPGTSLQLQKSSADFSKAEIYTTPSKVRKTNTWEYLVFPSHRQASEREVGDECWSKLQGLPQ